MADLTLRLRVDPKTGKREIVIDYTSDSDALPMEHEEEHRRLAGQVVDGGLANAKISVSRAGDSAPADAQPAAPDAKAAPVATPAKS